LLIFKDQMSNSASLLQALQSVVDPNTGKTFASNSSIVEAQIDGATAKIEVVLAYPAKSQHVRMAQSLAQAAKTVAGVSEVDVHIRTDIAAHAIQVGMQKIPHIKNIIAVASGKGGVGKSTTAVNLALALAAEGAQVGLLDADIYGPSLPLMLGLSGRPESEDGKSMEPLENYGVQVMSIGFLVNPDDAMVWRGPMATQALEQLLKQTNWKDLDYLIVDMPPGTGDIQLTMAQRVPLTGAVIVTTPQDVALLDAKKGMTMFEKVSVPIFGLVENMAVHVCSQCGHVEHIFGEDGGKRMAEQAKVPYLGALPLKLEIRELSDLGHPVVLAEPESEVAGIYKSIARQLGVRVASQAKDQTGKFATIKIKSV
jgi:ATP-binding protein involved in chromosome partitioning